MSDCIIVLTNGVIVLEPVFDRQEIQKYRPPMLRTRCTLFALLELRCSKGAGMIGLPD